MLDILRRIDEKKAKLDTYRPLPPDLVRNLQEWFAVEFTYNSNAIEGNTLTRVETAVVIEKGLTVSGKPLKDHLEAINHAIALDLVYQLAIEKKPYTIELADILDLHRLILKGIDDKNAGRLRSIQVSVKGSDTIFPGPLKVPELMDEFVSSLHATQEHPIKIAADAHLALVQIHPFVDGNGRTARLLMNLILLQTGYPIAVIKQDKRVEYINAVAKAEKTGDMQDFYSIVYQAVEASLDKYLDAASKTIR